MIEDQVKGPGTVVDQVFKMDFHHGRLIQPIEVRGKTVCDIRKFDIRIRPPQNADLEPRIEIGQGLVVGVVNVIRFHLGDVENM